MPFWLMPAARARRNAKDPDRPCLRHRITGKLTKLGLSKPQKKQAEKLSEASGGETNRMGEEGGGVGEKA